MKTVTVGLAENTVVMFTSDNGPHHEGGNDAKFFDSNGVRLRYVEQGDGQPIVLLHGNGNTLQSWIDAGVFKNLAADFRVIAFDARGHGKSAKPHDPKQYGPEMARDVVRLLDHLSIPKAHIIGYSMGAGTTLQLLTMNPERFLTAVLGASSVIDRQRAAAVTVPTLGIVGTLDGNLARLQELRSYGRLCNSSSSRARRMGPVIREERCGIQDSSQQSASSSRHKGSRRSLDRTAEKLRTDLRSATPRALVSAAIAMFRPIGSAACF